MSMPGFVEGGWFLTPFLILGKFWKVMGGGWGSGGVKKFATVLGGEVCLREQHIQNLDIYDPFYPLNHNKVYFAIKGPPSSGVSGDHIHLKIKIWG